MELQFHMCDYSPVNGDLFALKDPNNKWIYSGFSWSEGGAVEDGTYWCVLSTPNTGVIYTEDYIEHSDFCSISLSRTMASSDQTSFAEPSGRFVITQIFDNGTESKVWEEYGPRAWEVLEPIKLYPGRYKLKIEYFSLSLASTGCSIGGGNMNLIKKIDCYISDYKPPEPNNSLAELTILRGYTRYQETKKGSLECKFSVVFDDYTKYHEFIVNAFKKQFMFVDYDGICYMGLIAPDAFSGKIQGRPSEGYFYRDIKLLCGQSLGVGW